MMVRTSLVTAPGVIVALAGPPLRAAREPPNVVFSLVDDLRFDAMVRKLDLAPRLLDVAGLESPDSSRAKASCGRQPANPALKSGASPTLFTHASGSARSP